MTGGQGILGAVAFQRHLQTEEDLVSRSGTVGTRQAGLGVTLASPR